MNLESPPISEPQSLPVQSNYWERVRFALFAVLLLTILAGAIAAARDIEAIVGFGPVVALLGLAAAAFPFRGNLALRMTAFSAPVFALTVFLVIFRLRWSPTQAQAPIGGAILIYLWITTLLGIYFAVRTYLSDRERAGPFQFGLRSLFAATLLVAVVAGFVRMANLHQLSKSGRESSRILFPIAVGSAGVLVGAACLAGGYVYLRRRKEDPPPMTKENAPSIDISPPS